MTPKQLTLYSIALLYYLIAIWVFKSAVLALSAPILWVGLNARFDRS